MASPQDYHFTYPETAQTIEVDTVVDPVNAFFTSNSGTGSQEASETFNVAPPELDSRRPISNPLGRGPMVPQLRYRPHTTSDRRRYVEDVELEPPILFSTLRPEMEGFPLADAVSGNFANLAQRDDLMFPERGPSISVRINWPGYH